MSREGLTVARSSGLESPYLHKAARRVLFRLHRQSAGGRAGNWSNVVLLRCTLPDARSSWTGAGQRETDPGQPSRAHAPAGLRHRHQVVWVQALEIGCHFGSPGSDHGAFGGSRAPGAPAGRRGQACRWAGKQGAVKSSCNGGCMHLLCSTLAHSLRAEGRQAWPHLGFCSSSHEKMTGSAA